MCGSPYRCGSKSASSSVRSPLTSAVKTSASSHIGRVVRPLGLQAERYWATMRRRGCARITRGGEYSRLADERWRSWCVVTAIGFSMPPPAPTVGREVTVFRSSVRCPLTPISRDAAHLRTCHWNLQDWRN